MVAREDGQVVSMRAGGLVGGWARGWAGEWRECADVLIIRIHER